MFEYTDPEGDRLAVDPLFDDNGEPVIALTIPTPCDAGVVYVPLSRVEELVAGIRDTARQAAVAPRPAPPEPDTYVVAATAAPAAAAAVVVEAGR